MSSHLLHWAKRHPCQRAAESADQAEQQALQLGSAVVDWSLHDERIAGALDDFETRHSGELADWSKRDADDDEGHWYAATELERRSRSLGDAYPFRVEGNRIHYRGTTTLVYEFCLAAAAFATHKPITRMFERLARLLLLAWLGPGAEGDAVGAGREEEDIRAERFKQLIVRLSKSNPDLRWNPTEVGKPDDPSYADVKDCGLDVVAWKRPGDTRWGSLIVFAQCACGNNWATKLRDVNRERLEDWIRPWPPVEPVRAFTTPHHVANEGFMRDVTAQAGLFLDRSRLTWLAENTSFSGSQTEEDRDALFALVQGQWPSFERAALCPGVGGDESP